MAQQDKNMAARIDALVEYKTQGNRQQFAEILGWSPSYLSKMLGGTSVGISPLVTILQQFPEVNARWLLLGEGAMVDNTLGSIKSQLFYMLQMEQYIPVMTKEQQTQLAQGKRFTQEECDQLQVLLDEKNRIFRERYEAAVERSTRAYRK